MSGPLRGDFFDSHCIAISSTVFRLQTDSGGTPSRYQRYLIYTTLNSTVSGLYNSVADNTGLSSFV